METSIFIAKIIGLTYLSLWVGLLFSWDYYKKAFSKILDDTSYMLFWGIMGIVVGFLIIQYHNIWVTNWTVAITVIGWIALAKWAFLLAFPKSFKIFAWMFKSDKYIKIMGPTVIIVGWIFVYLGFFY